MALQYLRAEKFQTTRDIIVLFTGDEETSGNGSRRAATEWRSLIDAEYALNSDAGAVLSFPTAAWKVLACKSPRKPMPIIS